MPTSDPYQPAEKRLYECTGCGTRVRSEQQPVECDRCGGLMQDLSVPRE